MDGYKELAYAVSKSACNDYLNAIIYPNRSGSIKAIHDCEDFFRSNRFAIFMPGIDPEELITALRAKAKRVERSVKKGRMEVE